VGTLACVGSIVILLGTFNNDIWDESTQSERIRRTTILLFGVFMAVVAKPQQL
jgi:uncharacterized protein YhhL (DUF1145 family)